MENRYVFVVCGDDEHIHTLNYSIRFLKHFSKLSIIVVTDTSRNQINIAHEEVVDIKTPTHFNHHQASIYLKTGLHRFLDMAHQYCYLDTDIIAINAAVDSIFDYFKAPITFSTDHCKMSDFSESAVRFILPEKFEKRRQHFERKLKKYQAKYYREEARLQVEQEKIESLQKEWEVYYAENQKSNQLGKRLPNEKYLQRKLSLARFILKKHLKANGKSTIFSSLLKYVVYYDKEGRAWRTNKKNEIIFHHHLSFKDYFLSAGYLWNSQTKQWNDAQGNSLVNNMPYHQTLAKETGFVWNEEAFKWTDPQLDHYLKSKPQELRRLIKEKFKVEVEKNNWQHWNGGVFLFNKTSTSFLENWHQWTMEIFKDEKWYTRDQGTLIATAWKFNLGAHPTLPIEYNFIADYFHPTMHYKGKFTFDVNEKRKNIQPHFLHVYHHFGDQDWLLWQDIEGLLDLPFSYSHLTMKTS